MKQRKSRISLMQRWQRFLQIRAWRMDIHPTAWIASSALIDRTYPKGIHIGEDCFLDEEVVVLTHDLTRGIYCHTRIGDRTILGPRAIVLPGVTIGSGCRIAAGAIVNMDVPDGASVIGNPGRIAQAGKKFEVIISPDTGARL